MKETFKVYIADDHTLFRKALVTLLRTFKKVDEVMEARNGKELLALIKHDAPDVAIVDLQMPVMDGAETCENIIQKYPDVKVIILTMHDSGRFILRMMDMGVHAFLLKNTEPEELERAIYAVVEKDFYHNDLVASILRKNVKEKRRKPRPLFGPAALTDREKEILILVCQELTMKEIGQRLFLSENTVRNHRVNIMEKVGVNNIVGLVKYAYEIGLVL
ncbi:MAG: response regulator transcription factor [Cyclobacteriaceae bacterium]|nr:response regulator transcription factor [Cyclobacteriaceae bacterium]MDH4295361.1 response regulator transcription factor [Cyclobacteriaceae bacterium]MDH5247466.1 response regulator transcription factor [Cyclobacteriaceae bacterium]